MRKFWWITTISVSYTHLDVYKRQVYHAKKLGYKGVIAATSGNYGAAVASQAAIAGLECIIVQECYDSKGVGQPEIIEKARKCEALGAEVVQLTVGPELFYKFILLLEETGYFNASLYTPFGIAGVETLGYEISMQFREKYGKDPDAVVCTNAGGGNLTGTARGLIKAGAVDTTVIGASIDLSGLHMASDKAFNLKSCTTGHTGFGVPYAVDPDHSDVPRSAARPLRYMDRYVTITQGDVFYITECLATLEGLEKGPAGNTSQMCIRDRVECAEAIEEKIGRELEFVAGGSTTSYPRVLEKNMPRRINLLRIGEAMLLASCLLYTSPKPDGGVRNLGVPTVVDRFVQQAVAQILTPIFEEQFHDHSYGFRPNRCAPVSYTHLDVYKRQVLHRTNFRCRVTEEKKDIPF